MDEDTIFQENLERLEAGEQLEEFATDLTDEQTALLEIVRQIQAVSQFSRDPGIVAAQHQHIVSLWNPKKENAPLELLTSFFKWAVPIGILSMICIAFMSITGGLAWLNSQQGGVAELSSTREIVKAPAETPLSNTPLPNSPTDDDQVVEAFPPIVVTEETPPAVSEANIAILKTVHGIVQLQQADNSWQTIETIEIQVGQTFRTWVSSQAKLYFYDGSVVTLEANTRLTLEALNVPDSSSRETVLFQPYGETSHDVTSGSADSYVVRTPSSKGTAKGTIFQVIVNENKSSQFSVVEGIVNVTGKQNNVQLYAGETTSVAQNADPVDPVFWITGEGEVSQMGEVWVIGGLPFETHPDTVIIGEPQIGDLVSVRGRLLTDGTRLADQIVLLAPTPIEQFRLTGIVESMGADVWMISGQEVHVDTETRIDAGIAIGSRVLVSGIIREGGVLLASHIALLGTETWFEFTGLVEAIDDPIWTIAGVTITTDQNTEIKDNPEVGDLVKVEGWILPDGIWLAIEIKKEAEPGRFELTGIVQSIAPWVVSGIFFEVDDFTLISPGITVGATVHVEGRILENGIWLATSIHLLEDTNMLVFIGIVDSIDPWVVNGLMLTIDENTVFVGEIVAGSLVRVEVLVQPDGTWLVLRMTLIETGPVVGCIEFADTVVALTSEEITLATGIVIPRAIAEVEGDLQLGSQVFVKLCFGPDQVPVYAFIIVMGEPLPPRPTPLPTGEKVTICHVPPGNPGNAHTITVGESAVSAHLAHGDYLGPCNNQ